MEWCSTFFPDKQTSRDCLPAYEFCCNINTTLFHNMDIQAIHNCLVKKKSCPMLKGSFSNHWTWLRFNPTNWFKKYLFASAQSTNYIKSSCWWWLMGADEGVCHGTQVALLNGYWNRSLFMIQLWTASIIATFSFMPNFWLPYKMILIYTCFWIGCNGINEFKSLLITCASVRQRK